MIKFIKRKISKIVSASRTYLARFDTLGIFPGTYFPPGGGGVPNPTKSQGFFVKKKTPARANNMSLAPLHSLLDKKDKQSHRASYSYVSLARFFDAVKPYVSILLRNIGCHYAICQANTQANQKGVQINHGRGPPFSLTVSRVSLCPI